MTASNGFAVPVSERRTFFTDLEHQFPEIHENGKLETMPFLLACRGVVELVGLMGRAMTPVKYDIQGNIDKLEKKYQTNPDRFYFLHDMIKIELDETGPGLAIEGLLWLKRALEYFRTLLQCLVEDHKSHGGQDCLENITPFYLKAYDDNLKQYHGWISQKIFRLCIKAVPWRKELLTILAHGREGMEGVVMIDMEEFLLKLSSNIDIVNAMYKEWQLDSDQKV